MLRIENTVLIVVDVQGKLASLMYDKQTLFENIKKCIKGGKVLEIPILWVEQNPNGLGETIPEIANLLGDIEPIVKMSDHEDQIDEIENPKGDLDQADGAIAEAKAEMLRGDNFQQDSWYAVKCGVCGRRCCSPCTADGDINRCAETRFRNCSTCGHASSRHYRVRY